MHDPALIEAMARACCCPANPACKCSSMSLSWISEATAALTALCTARPDVAAVLRGVAVAVPRAEIADIKGNVRAIRRMLAASPYATKETDDAR